MRTLLAAAVVVGVFVAAESVSGQAGAPKPPATFEDMLKQIGGASGDGGTGCVHRQTTTGHALNTSLTVDGRTFTCVAVLDHTLATRGMAWTARPMYTPAAMMRRISGATSGEPNVTTCVLPDRAAHTLGAVVFIDAQAYRCAAMFDQDLQERGVAWTPVQTR